MLGKIEDVIVITYSERLKVSKQVENQHFYFILSNFILYLSC